MAVGTRRSYDRSLQPKAILFRVSGVSTGPLFAAAACSHEGAPQAARRVRCCVTAEVRNMMLGNRKPEQAFEGLGWLYDGI
jgi:hypothetical protein